MQSIIPMYQVISEEAFMTTMFARFQLIYGNFDIMDTNMMQREVISFSMLFIR